MKLPAPPDLRGDPWTRVQTVHGFAADELISVFQKSIRRGLVENAVLVAYELYALSEEAEDRLWRRLEVICVEDVGFGNPQAPLVIQALEQFRRRIPRESGDRFTFLVHAVRTLALSQKDRGSDEMANWVRLATEAGEATPEVFDWCLDMHTRRGQALDRDFAQWFSEGARVDPELPGRDLTYYHRLRALLDGDETPNS